MKKLLFLLTILAVCLSAGVVAGAADSSSMKESSSAPSSSAVESASEPVSSDASSDPIPLPAIPDVVGPFEVSLTGAKFGDGPAFEGDVTVSLKVTNEQSGQLVMVQSEGVWMRLLRQSDGFYRARFTEKGQHVYSFCTSDANARNREVQQVSFAIEPEVAQLTREIGLMAAEEGLTTSYLSENRTKIRDLQNRYNKLKPYQRDLIPQATRTHMEAIIGKAQTSQQAGWEDFTAPYAPIVSVRSVSPGLGNTYPGAVEVVSACSEFWDFKGHLVNDGTGWKPLEADENGKYIYRCTDAGEYSIDFALEDLALNHSPAATMKFSIDPQRYAILAELESLLKFPTESDEYDTAVEKAYRLYRELTPQAQVKLPAQDVERIQNRYRSMLSRRAITDATTDSEGNSIQAIGFVNSLNARDTTLIAERLKQPTVTPSNLDKQVLAQYYIDFHTASAAKIAPTTPVRITMQVPTDLRDKRGVEMLHVSGTSATPLNAKVRSTDQGLVLTFETTATGTFLFVADAT